ncbi:hypothetical protein GCM10027586_06220 [Kineococcus gypseus]|uniref:hypothetical protein n=1 Tax=Kineococcus gypseus TaxID=1637102 RepID=UPI003D7D4FD4
MTARRTAACVPTQTAATVQNPSHEVLTNNLTASGRSRAAANADPFWWQPATMALQTLAAAEHTFNTDSLRELGICEPDVPQRWAALFSVAQARGTIECVGASVMVRPDGTTTACRMWRGTATHRHSTKAGGAL